MLLYDTIIDDIKALQKRNAASGKLKTLHYSSKPSWPSAGNRNLVLQSDTSIELGNPKDEAVSLSLWTQAPEKVNANHISLVGPDITEANVSHLPFGKIILVDGTGFNEENAYERYREMDLVRFDISLKGYMMRAASQNMREWSRISKEAADQGFSFSVLGSALIAEYKKLDYITSVEVLFITSADEEVALFGPMAEQVIKINGAMSKMVEEMASDCSACEYEEVCGEVAALRKMRKSKSQRTHSAA